MNQHQTTYFQVGVSVVLALLCTLLPWPRTLSAIMPQWAFLVVLYWVMTMPERIGVGFALVVGLLVDSLMGTLFGQHAFAFVFIAYCALKIRMPLRHLPMWQQVMVISLFSLGNLLLQCIVMTSTGEELKNAIWFSVMTSALFWPLLVFWMRRFQRQYEYYI